MVGNLAKVEQRMGTVETASKITTAMKLVSLSKLQKYKRLSESVQAFTQAYGEIPSESYQGDDKPTLTVCLLPDLGLATAYTQGLLKFLRSQDLQHIMWIGSQRFEKIKHGSEFTVVNDYQSSENLSVQWLYNQVVTYFDDYAIQLARPIVENEGVSFKIQSLDKQLVHSDFIVYEPSYALANDQYRQSYLLIQLYDLFYQAKVAEYTTRRIAMEKATDNADEMKKALQNQYNRIRQEKITQEIAELTSGVL